MGRDNWPTESPISPVSPYYSSKDYYELEDMVIPKSSNWNFFFWVAFVVMAAIGLLTLGNSTPNRGQPAPSPSISSSVVSSSPSAAAS